MQVDISEKEMGPIAVVSMREAPSHVRNGALRRLLAAVTVEVEAPPLVLLPGACAGWPKDERMVARIAAEYGATVLFECVRSGWRVARADGQVEEWASWQTFGSSRDADREPGLVERLVAAGQPDAGRRLHLAGHDIGLLACGENNVLRNAQSQGNAVSVRHGAATRLFPGATVAFNGAHTEMGNLGKLWKRFEWLSADPPGRRPRLALFGTNNTLGSWGRTLGAWWGGEKLATGAAVLPAGTARGMRLVVDVRDQARALVVDVEGCRAVRRQDGAGSTSGP
jgi:hypothetical protein